MGARLLRQRLLLGVVCLMALMSLAAADATLQMRSFTVENGGGRSSGGAFTLTGIAGQPELGVSTGSAFRLTGGLLPGFDGGVVNLPIVRR